MTRLAIVHYHLRRGGVARVIESTLAALRGREVRVAVLSGDAEAGPALQSVHREVRGLDYTGSCDAGAAKELAEALRSRARDALGGEPDAWHVHNHALGKNPNFNLALRDLADSGARLLLHLHDFAEDGRPAQYRVLRDAFGEAFDSVVYPDAGHLHYAVLNRRDFEFLRAAGLDPERLHLLPNPVAAAAAPPAAAASGDPARVLYLTRAIRRKNLGELLLWAALETNGRRFASSLAPDNPREQIFYHRWTAFSRQLNLPVDFNVGGDPDRTFEEVVASASQLITTSMAEGFGLAFLEPWLFGKALVGRDLPEITGDFSSAGIALDHLYRRLELPVEWVDAERLRGIAGAELQRLYAAYGRPCAEADVVAALADMVRNGRVDFGRLGEPLQEAVIARVRESADARSEISPSLPAPGDANRRVETNRRAILEAYSPAGYGDRLEAAYRALLDSPVTERTQLDGEKLLNSFLRPNRFCLIRT